MIRQITLQKWIEQKQEELRAFELYWRKQHEENPQDFPLEIPMGDWEEQFNFYCEKI